MRTQRTTPQVNERKATPKSWLAFSLIELLVVISIIGVLASVTLPAFKGFGKSISVDAAVRQTLVDLAFARQTALTTRSTVLMLFVSGDDSMFDSPLTDDGQFRSYALFATGSVGDQPGRPTRKFLTEWRSLPEGMVFLPSKLRKERYRTDLAPTNRSLPYMRMPIHVGGDLVRNPPDFHLNRPELVTTVEQNGTDVWVTNYLSFPYIAFRPDGGLYYGFDESISIGQGSVFTIGSGNNRELDVIVSTNEPVQHIHINALTGRADVAPLQFGALASQ